MYYNKNKIVLSNLWMNEHVSRQNHECPDSGFSWFVVKRMKLCEMHAGNSMRAVGSQLDCRKTLRKVRDAHRHSCNPKVNSESNSSRFAETDNLWCLFNLFTRVFFREFCCGKNYRPLPPMLGDGQVVNLYKLFCAVRDRGGYKSVTQNGLWDSLGKELGLGLGFGATVKLIYVKYLDVLEKWLDRRGKDKISDDRFRASEVGGHSNSNGFSMELEGELREFLSEILDLERKDEDISSVDSDVRLAVTRHGSLGIDEDAGLVGREMENIEDNLHLKPCRCTKFRLCRIVDYKGVPESDGSETCDDNVDSFSASTVQNGGKSCNTHNAKDTTKQGVLVMKSLDEELYSTSSEVNGESFSQRKRKRQSMWGMLSWVLQTAKEPCDPAVGEIPERSKWKSIGNEEPWKQVLLAREQFFLKRQFSSPSDQEFWQKRQMHPVMYDDHIRSDRPRSSPRLISLSNSKAQASSEISPHVAGGLSGSKSLCKGKAEYGATKPSNRDFIAGWPVDGRNRDRVAVGTNYQAEIPVWAGIKEESDSKYLGVRIWPQAKLENRYLIERDPIGKGRQECCGCQLSGSPQCVRFHVGEKQSRLKIELGSAFYSWKFDQMGEGVAVFWTRKAEKKFDDVVKANPPSMDKCFWDEIFESFPTKCREDLVSYYFNVFLLRRRAEQNRLTPSNIDSDDDETEYGSFSRGTGQASVNSPSSIFYSPKKQHRNDS